MAATLAVAVTHGRHLTVAAALAAAYADAGRALTADPRRATVPTNRKLSFLLVRRRAPPPARSRSLTVKRTILRLVVAFAATASLTLPQLAHAAGTPTATFSKDSGWGTGYQGKYTITNGGSTTLNGWKIEVDVPAGGSISSAWDAVMTHSGDHYTFTNQSYNAAIAPGASTSFGFNGAPESATPTNCTLNGAPCEGGGGGTDTTPPSVPGGLHVTGTTSSSITLAWDASTDDVGVAGYRVYEGSSLVASPSGTSATVGGLAASTSHTYTVTARDAAGNESAKSAAVTGTTQSGGGGGTGTYQKIGYYPQWGVYGRDF
jgi:chitinase